jgi:hypothetical protein
LDRFSIASGILGFPQISLILQEARVFAWPLIGDSYDLSWYANTMTGESWVCYNRKNFWDGPNQSGDSGAGNHTDLQMYGIGGVGGRQWFGGRYYLLDAIVGWSVDGYTRTSIPAGVGYLFNTLIVTKDLPMDTEVVDDEGKKWLVISRPETKFGISILMRVPQGYN